MVRASIRGMFRRPSGLSRLLIAASCAAVLLSVQVLGLHFHRHLGLHHAADSHDAQPAVWDAAAHLGGAHAGDQAVHADEDLDVVVSSLPAPKLKFAQVHFTSLELAASPVVTTWLAVAPPARDPVPGSLSFRLRPPSQAPPIPV